MEDQHSSNTEIYSLLDKIEFPDDLRKLNVEQLPELCKEIRRFIIHNLSNNPGHFASSMGAVEIAVAVHYVFNTPQDHVVWDVGHQAYAHKILTGRRKEFGNIRKAGGPSGFPYPAESQYDTFMAGHAGNSISAALGMALADSLNGNSQNKAIAIIGDASISGGLAFEGLNNVSNDNADILIILNDNDMSIDDNVGALHRYLSRLTTSPRYNKWRYKAYNFLRSRGMFNENKRGALLRFNNSIKSFVSNTQNIFEGLNIRYFGPHDGHDVVKLVEILRKIKDMKGPRLLHLSTVKGKGFDEAERNPAAWHAPGKFNPTTGERAKSTDVRPPKWQEVFGKSLVELAEKDNRITGITAAMLSGTSMSEMAKVFPSRTFDSGIAEGHAVTFAGGMATRGMRPFVAIYSSFLQRAYDNIINDVAIQGLPVTFCIDRAGIVGEDGVTHHGLFDIAYMSVIPGMKVTSPMDEATLRNLMFTSLSLDGPMSIRYPRGEAINTDWKSPFQFIEPGKGRCITPGSDGSLAVLSLGPIGNDVKNVIAELTEDGISVAHYDMIWVKPLDKQLLEEIAKKHSCILTVEDGAIREGFGESVALWLMNNGYQIPVHHLGVPDQWVHHGSVSGLRAICGYDIPGIKAKVLSLIEKNKAE